MNSPALSRSSRKPVFRCGAAAVAVLLALAPVAADARPGGGGSFGSRGSHTYMAPPATNTNPGGASSFDRSLTPNGGQYGSSMAGGAAGMMPRSHPFATGLVGGLVGFGIGRMLFGHGMGGEGGSGFGGLLQLLIFAGILFFLVRWLMRRFAGGGMRGAMPIGAYGAGPSGGGRAVGGNVAITPADYQQFEQALRDVQQAWSMQDLRSLSRFATPEMVSYFSEQLSDLASRNFRNVVSDVRMEQGDLSEAWSEGQREFATVAMRYSMIDVTTDLTGRVVDGSPNERQTITELWTFVRTIRGSWLLSAIQQGR